MKIYRWDVYCVYLRAYFSNSDYLQTSTYFENSLRHLLTHQSNGCLCRFLHHLHSSKGSEVSKHLFTSMFLASVTFKMLPLPSGCPVSHYIHLYALVHMGWLELCGCIKNQNKTKNNLAFKLSVIGSFLFRLTTVRILALPLASCMMGQITGIFEFQGLESLKYLFSEFL